MTAINHRRKNKPPVNARYSGGWTNVPGYSAENQVWSYYHNGYSRLGRPKTESQIRIGRTDGLDKSLHGWGRLSRLADRSIGAGIGNDFSHGHRGMAKAVRGAKKFVRTRLRFHENRATRALAQIPEEND